MKIRIWGCRGSLPAPLTPNEVEEKITAAIHDMPEIDTSDIHAVRDYVRGLDLLKRGTAGGNTTCVEIQSGGTTIVVDAGTGIRELGQELMKGPFGRGEGELHLLFSHTHWDHVQGFPFFLPAYIPGNRITIYSLHDLQTALIDQQRSLYFPVPMSVMAASIEYVTLSEGQSFAIGDVQINTIRNAHPGVSYGYRFEDEHSVFVFASDSEYKQLDDMSVYPHVEFFKGADALIFDAQYTLGEGWVKEDWGHSSAMIGVDMALASAVKRLILVHHDPSHNDSQLRQILTSAEAYRDEKSPDTGCEIIIGHEGLMLNLAPEGSVGMRSTESNQRRVFVPTSVFDERGVEQVADKLDEHAIIRGSVIDLSQVETLSTASLKLLVQLQQQRKHAPLVLAAPSASAMRVIELGGFRDFFCIYPTVDAAFEAVKARESLELPGNMLAGHYLIERLLGKGKISTVLCAKDQHTEHQVVVKIIDPTYGDESLQRLFSQRDRLLRLDHPHLLHIYALVKEEHFTYIIEAYHPGNTLDSLLQTEGDGLPFDKAFEIAIELCEAIEYAHRQGVVHGDLKPSNIFIDERGIGVGSLALGRLHEGLNLQKVPMLRQTAAYLAPEQIIGQAIDARTDLYALGVILHQLFAGRPPFQGSDQDVMQAHLSQEPESPRAIKEQISPSLEHLILKLLAKNPAKRYGNARQVQRILGVLAAGETGLTLDREMRLIGREKQLEQLQEAWSKAESGQGQLVFISGEQGVGKTSLSQQAAARMNAEVVLLGRCYEQQDTTAFYLFAEVLSAYLTSLPPELFDKNSRELINGFAAFVPDIKEIDPDLEGLPPLEPEQEQLRLMTSMTRFISQATTSRPWVLILDDLQWADASSLELLRNLVFELPGIPMLILGTYRDTEVKQGHPLAEVLYRYSHHRSISHIKLDRLEQDDVREMLTRLWDDSVPVALVETIYRHTGGNPFYIEEIASNLEAEHLVGLHQGTWQYPKPDTVQLPNSVLEVVRHRLGHLHRDTQTLLQQAAVLGKGFDFEALHIMCGLPDWTVLEHLDLALQQQFIQEAEGDYSFQFRHGEIHVALYEAIPAVRRRLWHRQAGEALEGLAMPHPEVIAEILALHFEEAHLLEKAISYGFQAAERAQDAYANDSAVAWYRQIIGMLDRLNAESAKRFRSLHLDVLLNYGKVLRLTGDWDVAKEQYQAALDLAVQLNDRHRQAKSQIAIGELYRLQGDYATAKTWYEQARSNSEQVNDQPGLATALICIGSLELIKGDYSLARTYHEQGLTIRRQIANQRGVANAVNNLAIIAVSEGNFSEAQDQFEETLRIRRNVGDKWAIANSLKNLGELAQIQSKYEEALGYLQEALALEREIGNKGGIGNVLITLGNTLRDQGRFQEAWAMYEETMPIVRDLQDMRNMAYLLEAIGGQLALQGDHVQGLRLASAGAALREEIGSPLARPEQERLDTILASARQALDEETAKTAWESGKTLSIEEAIALALSVYVP